MIFSLMHYLSEGLGAREAQLAKVTVDHTEVEQQIAVLNQGFKAYFRGRRVAQLRGVADSYRQAISDEQQKYRSDQDLITQLSQELAGHPIIRNGRLEL